MHPDRQNPRGLDFEYCFALWEHYQRYLLTFRNNVDPARYTELHYETLLREPESTLRIIVGRIGLMISDARLTQTAGMINAGRLDNRAFATPYQEFIPDMWAHPLMVALGYGASAEDNASAT
ncbi:MAG: sulfotransferase [Anaerolineae bacterium]|nr:sulfotransferase [Anaerolineae bacterium]